MADSPDFRVKLGRRLYDARRAAGLTQAELAKQLDVSTSWVTNVEQGQYSIDLQVMAMLARILGYPLDWFLSDQDGVPNPFRMPTSRQEWEVAYAGDAARAHAHASLDEVFKKQGGR